ncbi:Hypothetical protein AA314_07133 [Archangium gephyra]|uniref:Uncharacterized protein n=1 Tax=Archangium gephyra TaxID=48 RepID=A0AAC8TGT2_9BACT|nr:Hypothetical protein AA314_07133 [Archangium gephyra]
MIVERGVADTQLLGERGEHVPRSLQPAFRHAGERPLHAGLHRALGGNIQLPARLGEEEERLARVEWIRPALDDAPLLQALHDTGERAGMDMEYLREPTRGDAGVLPHEPHHQPLRARESHGGLHGLGGGAQSLVHGPQQAQELQALVQRGQLVLVRGGGGAGRVELLQRSHGKLGAGSANRGVIGDSSGEVLHGASGTAPMSKACAAPASQDGRVRQGLRDWQSACPSVAKCRCQCTSRRGREGCEKLTPCYRPVACRT